jgi:hypothetical protein
MAITKRFMLLRGLWVYPSGELIDLAVICSDP